MSDKDQNYYVQLAAVDISKELEKKQNLSYLSWSFAVDKLMRNDPQANWEFHQPEMYGDTMMISCTVTAFGKPIRMHLPVMDHKNQAIKNPDAFAVNKNMMRCLVKAIACHGLGINVYAGEDLPLDEDGHSTKAAPKAAVKPAPVQKAQAPTEIAGNEKSAWQLKISTEPGGDIDEWSKLVIDAANIQLEFAKSQENVSDIFKANRNIFTTLKEQTPAMYDALINLFSTYKEKFPKPNKEQA